VREIACCFAAHLRTTRSTKGHPIKGVTIDQYVRTWRTIWSPISYISSTVAVATAGRLTMLLAGYAASDDAVTPRLRQKIPMTYPLACIMYRLVGATAHWRQTARLAGGGGNGLWPIPTTRRVPAYGGRHTADASSETRAIALCSSMTDECVCVCDLTNTQWVRTFLPRHVQP
jgi:hypothetical protein